MPSPLLRLGGSCSLTNRTLVSYGVPAHHLVTHGVVVGMTGSGKTGMVTVLCEEALRSQVPVLMIDVKGDLPNLLLAFPSLAADAFLPWAESAMGPHEDRPIDAVAAALAAQRAKELATWGIGEADLWKLHTGTAIRLLTPGSTAGESVHLLSSLERRSARWDTDLEAARSALSAALSLVLRLVGRDPDPARSRDHVLLSVLAERRLRAGGDATLSALLDDLNEPPIDSVGALTVDAFLPKTERQKLASALNNLLASPTFAAWRTGETLDVGAWLAPKNGQTQAVIVSVAHLDEAERNLVLGLLLEEILAWTRSLSGTSRLRALVVFDEVYGYLPPHPHNPPTKRPLVALLKQARAFGVGVVVATQNPMDLDYRALGNAGFWCIGRLQTDADRERLLDGLGVERGRAKHGAVDMDTLLQKLTPRWFLVRDVHAGKDEPLLLHPRWAMSFLRGPMTRVELQRAVRDRGRPRLLGRARDTTL
jgi:hypothetical protein